MVIGDVEVIRRQLCCCHSFMFPASVSFISKVRGNLCCCHSFIFSVNVSFISKVRVTGGPGGIVLLSVNCFQRQCVIHFKRERHRWVGVCLSSAPVGWLRFFRLKFFMDHQPFQFLQFFNGLHTCFNFRVRGVWTRGVTCAIVACIPLTYLVPWHCKCFIYPILAYAKGAFCVPAHFTPGTQKHPFACANCTFCASTFFFERERKNTLLRAQKAPFAPVTKVGWVRE